MSVDIVCIGSLKEDYLKKAQAEYLKRLLPLCKINVIELSEYKLSKDPDSKEIENCIKKEGEEILKKLSGAVIPLCIEGKKFDSVGLSDKLSRLATDGKSKVTFVIGGSYGLSDEVKARGEIKLSMSDMTFPHQLARIMLLEQIYRAFQIQKGSKYHK